MTVEQPQVFVLDTSVVVKWFLYEDHSDDALRLLEVALRTGYEFLAPGTLPPELFNTLWQRYRRRSLDIDEVRRIWRDYHENAPVALFDPADLIERAAELVLETGIIIYDALFVSLAENMNTVMITADRHLLATLKESAHSQRVFPLPDIEKLLP